MKISFLGGVRGVTGSCFLLETKSTKILIDCGMFQGKDFADQRNRADFGFNPKDIDAVLITHAHLDHTGRIPKLINEGFKGTLFTTRPTADLTKIIWEDALGIMEYEEKKDGQLMLFSEDDVKKGNEIFSVVEYKQQILVGDIKAMWHNAGHILGSGFIELEVEGKRIVFSGDLGNTDIPILRQLEPLPKTDVLVMESTYGGHLHEDPKDRAQALRACIIDTLNKRGVLLIPAFAIERIQEILYELNELTLNKQIPRVPIFLDSPMAIQATKVFKNSKSFYDKEAMKRVSEGDDLFDFPGLYMTLSRDESRKINSVKAPKVIIAGSGMMNGGRVLHHARRYLQDNNSTILFVGYQAEGTLGREILDGSKEVRIYDSSVEIRAQISKLGSYSAHADRDHLVAWVQSGKELPGSIYLVHGEKDSQEILSKQIKKETGIECIIPEFKDEVVI